MGEGKMGVGKMGEGKMGVGKMGVDKMGLTPKGEEIMHHNTFAQSQHLVPFFEPCFFTLVNRFVVRSVACGGWLSTGGGVVRAAPKISSEELAKIPPYTVADLELEGFHGFHGTPLLKGCLRVYLVSLRKRNYIYYGPH